MKVSQRSDVQLFERLQGVSLRIIGNPLTSALHSMVSRGLRGSFNPVILFVEDSEPPWTADVVFLSFSQVSNNNSNDLRHSN